MAAKQKKDSPKRKKKSTKRRYGPGRPTSKDLEHRKTRILEIATELFLEKGFAETSLVEVAKHAGVATRTIYQHYGNKEDIFRAVIDNHATMPRPNEYRPGEDDDSVFDTLLGAADYVCAYSLSSEVLPIQRLMIGESQRFPQLMQQVFEKFNNEFHANVTEIFEQLATDGKIPADNHTQSSKYFIDLLIGNSPMKLNMNWIKSGPSEEEIRDKIALFMLGRFGLKTDSNIAATKVKKTPKKAAKRKRT